MTQDKLYLKGELFLSLEVVAEIYKVQVVWLREVYDCGLLGTGVDSDATTCVAAVHLDRVATVVRLHETLGLDLDAIERTLEEDGPSDPDGHAGGSS